MPKISLSALPINYNDTEFFLTVFNAKQLFRVSKVSRAEDDPETGFQRTLGKLRANNIKKYLQDGNIIPGSVILSAQRNSELVYDSTNKTISFHQLPNAFLVIDGQHRLYGANMADVDVFLPACIINGLNPEQEVQYFLDVNGYQKGVPKALQIELLKFMAEPTSKDEIRRALFDALDKTVESPLCGKMARTKTITGKISHVAFKSALDPIIDLSPMNNLEQHSRIKLLLNYLTAIEALLISIFGTADKITNAAFFQSIMGAFVDACNLTMTRYSNYKVESFSLVFDPLTEFDWEVHTGTNQKAIKEFTNALRNAIAINNKISGDVF